MGLPSAPYSFCTRGLLPMIMCMLLSCPYLISFAFECSYGYPDPWKNCHRDPWMNCFFDFSHLQLDFYSTDMNSSSTGHFIYDGLGSYMNKFYPGSNYSSSNGLLIPNVEQELWETSPNGKEASFGISFTMGIDQSNGQSNVSMLFAMFPRFGGGDQSDDPRTKPTVSFTGPKEADIVGGKTSVKISTVPTTVRIVRDTPYSYDDSIGIEIHIEPSENSTEKINCSVWVDYNASVHKLSVYVALHSAGNPKPDKPIVSVQSPQSLNISYMMCESLEFGFYSTLGQLLRLNTLNTRFERLPHISCVNSADKGPNILLPMVLGPAVMVAGMAAVYYYFNSKYRRWKKDLDRLAKSIQCLPGMPTQVEFAHIKKATNNFHETMKLGRGGFGAVYKCRLPAPIRGEVLEVAVKKFTRNDNHRYEDFLAEVSVINLLRHKNIVPLIGWSYHKGEALLIYEYMRNGSLDQHLFWRGRTTQQQQDMAIRPWNTWYDIVRDVATGLHYIHHEHEPMVLHRDIKASNIMLDSNLHARLGDFGIACTVDVNRSSVTGIVGTWGYIAPDYVMNHKATRQTDVYAFGVLVLEIVTGRNWDVRPDDDHITEWIWRLHQQGKLLQAVDGSMLDVGDDQQDDVIEEVERLLLLGLACTNPNPSDRPSMVEAVQVITKLAPPLDVPLERPIFMWPPPEDWRLRNSFYSTAVSNFDGSSASTIELAQVSHKQPLSSSIGGHATFDTRMASGSSGGTAT